MYVYIRFAVKMSDQPISSNGFPTKIFPTERGNSRILEADSRMLYNGVYTGIYDTQSMNLILIDSFDSNLF